MFQSISEYLSLIGEYTNPAKIIFSAVTAAISGFVLIILVIILLRKFIFIKRRHVALKVLAILYVIIIPIVTAFFAFKWGLVNGIHKDIKEHLPAYTKSLDQSFSEVINEPLKELFNSGAGIDPAKTSMNDLIDTISVVVYDSYKTTLMKKAGIKEGITAKVSTFFLDLLSRKTISRAIQKGITKIVEKAVGVDEDITADVLDVRLNELLKSGLISKIVEIQVDKFFNGIKSGIYLVFGLILLVPLTEILIAVWLNKKAMAVPEPVI